MIEHEVELEILEHIHASPSEVRQRDLAHIVGKSLGMTNAILKRLTEKGLLKVSRINNRNISYAVTPGGMKELAGRSYRYFKRTIKNVVYYKDAVETEVLKFLRQSQAEDSAAMRPEIALVGPSDLDFIVEHLALKYGAVYRKFESASKVAERARESAAPILCFIGEEEDFSWSGLETKGPGSNAQVRLLRTLIESGVANAQ